jgi:DNA-binding NarL/FixJ family response regulator
LPGFLVIQLDFCYAIPMTASKQIRVAILDDHQSIIDGYLYRLSQTPDVEIVGTAMYADDLEVLLKRDPPTVLILDVHVQTSRVNTNPYPILHSIPKWLELYPSLSILVISMLDQKTLVKAVVEAGASGYILKDDQSTIQELGSVVRAVAGGGVHFSQSVSRYLLSRDSGEPELTPRQLEALSLCAAYPDLTTGVLARKLGVEHSTFRNLLSGVYLRLGVHTRMAAVGKAIQLGLITPSKPFMDV